MTDWEFELDLERLLYQWENLKERERKVLLTFAQRLLNGQRKYGAMSQDKKDWPYEAIEEVLDACVYMTACLNDRVDKAFNEAVAVEEKEVAQTSKEPDWWLNPDVPTPGH